MKRALLGLAAALATVRTATSTGTLDGGSLGDLVAAQIAFASQADTT